MQFLNCQRGVRVKKVLVIDDEEDMCSMLSRILEEEAFQVFTATSGEDGIKIFQEETPHLLLLDIRMQGLSGVETLRRIRNFNKESSVIIITGQATRVELEEATKLGVTDIIYKPFTLQQVIEAVSQALDKK